MDLQQYAIQEARRQGVDPNHILPLIGIESSWNPGAVSPKGAAGLMQLMPATARELGLSDADRFNPAKAIPAGVRYFKQQLDRFGSPELAYAAYNAGPGAVTRAGGVPNYPETQNYVRKNMAQQKPDLDAVMADLGYGRPASSPKPSAANLAAVMADLGYAKPAAKFIPKKTAAPTFLESLGEGLRDPVDGGAQLLTSLLPDSVVRAGNRVNNWLADKTGLVGRLPEGGVDRQVRDRKAAYEARRQAAGESGFDTARAVGNVITSLPTALIPGAASWRGSALIGAATGALQPLEKPGDSRVTNALLGAGGSLAGQAVGRGAAAAYQGGKALVEPFTKGGREAIAGRTLQRFSVDPAKAISRAQLTSPIPGVKPTLAEATLDPGLATLQKALGNVDPQISQRLMERGLQNNAARVRVLNKLAGDEATMEAAKAARTGASQSLYQSAFGQKAGADDALMALLQRPSLEKAYARAQKLASEQGENIAFGRFTPARQAETGVLDASGNPVMRDIPAQYPELSGKGLHYLKMALDDLTENPAVNGIGKHELRAMQGTRGALLDWTDAAIPDYGAARQAYAELSRPINQMEVGRELLRRGATPTVDALGNATLQTGRFAGAVRDSAQVVKKSLGRKGATLADVLSPEQLATVKAMSKDLSRKQAAENIARTAGSDTAKNLASQNLLRQTLGPTGLPQSWAESTLLGTVMKPAQMLYNNVAEPRIQAELADMLLNPARARAMLAAASKQPGPVQRRIMQYGVAPIPAALGLLSVDAFK